MSDIVSDAREWLDGYAGRESTHSDECHKWHDACLIARLVSECERLRQVVEQKNLTDEEREAVEYYIGTGGPDSVDATLLAMLSRTGTNLRQTCDDAAECHSQSEKLPERDRVANYQANLDSSTLTDAEREPVAWVAFATDGSESRYVSASQEQAQSIADDYNWCIAPLFAGLTAAEREAVDRQAKWLFNQAKDKPDIHSADLLLQEADTLRGLLERLGGGE